MLGTLGPTETPPKYSDDEINALKKELAAVQSVVKQHARELDRHRKLLDLKRSPKLQAAIEEANKKFPAHRAINQAYAFDVGGIPVTLDYLLWAIAKAEMRGSHPIEIFLTLEDKWDYVSLMLEAYSDYLRKPEENSLQELEHTQIKKEKWYQTNTFKFVVIPIVVALFLGIPSWLSLRDKTDLPKSETSIVAPEPNNYSRTSLYFRTKKRVDDFYESIRNEKLDPWLFINAGVEVRVTKYNGDIINYNGILFTGAPRIIFWSDDFIPPFIEDAIIKVFDQTIDECRKNGIEPEIYVYEAKRILSDFIYKIYNRMADMDQKLLKQVHPENSGRRDVKLEIEKMCKCLDEQYNAALLLASKGKNTN